MRSKFLETSITLSFHFHTWANECALVPFKDGDHYIYKLSGHSQCNEMNLHNGNKGHLFLHSQTSNLGSNPDPATNCHPGVSSFLGWVLKWVSLLPALIGGC